MGPPRKPMEVSRTLEYKTLGKSLYYYLEQVQKSELTQEFSFNILFQVVELSYSLSCKKNEKHRSIKITQFV